MNWLKAAPTSGMKKLVVGFLLTSPFSLQRWLSWGFDSRYASSIGENNPIGKRNW